MKNPIFGIYNSFYKYSSISTYSFLHRHELDLPVMSFFNTINLILLTKRNFTYIVFLLTRRIFFDKKRQNLLILVLTAFFTRILQFYFSTKYYSSGVWLLFYKPLLFYRPFTNIEIVFNHCTIVNEHFCI